MLLAVALGWWTACARAGLITTSAVAAAPALASPPAALAEGEAHGSLSLQNFMLTGVLSSRTHKLLSAVLWQLIDAS